MILKRIRVLNNSKCNLGVSDVYLKYKKRKQFFI